MTNLSDDQPCFAQNRPHASVAKSARSTGTASVGRQSRIINYQLINLSV